MARQTTMNKEKRALKKVLEELLIIPSPSEREERLREHIVSKLNETGFTSEVDEYGNILAVRGKAKKGKYIMLNAHMDNVSFFGRRRHSSYFDYSGYSGINYGYGYDDYNDYDDYGIYGGYNRTYYNNDTHTTQSMVTTLESFNVYDVSTPEAVERLKKKVDGGLITLEQGEFFSGGNYVKYVPVPESKSHELRKTVKTPDEKLADLIIANKDTKLLLPVPVPVPVKEEKKKDEKPLEDRKYICGQSKHYDGSVFRSKDGEPIGGDDKCGIAIILFLAQTTDLPLKVCLTVEEEIGCIGIKHVDPDFFKDVRYSLTVDRKGNDNLIYSAASTKLYHDPEFLITMVSAGIREDILVKLEHGAMADVIEISEYVPDCCNMSVGYYDAHTDREVIALNDLHSSFRWVRRAVTDLYEGIR